MEDTKNIINTDGPLNADVPLHTEDAHAEGHEEPVHTEPTPTEPTETAAAPSDKPAAAPATLTENQKDIQTYDDLVYDKYVEIVNTKVYNAQMIISFMLDNGLDVDEPILRQVAEARETVNTPKWNDVECKFMMTYNELVKRIYPVSIEMINNPSKIDKVELSGTILGKSNRESRKKKSAIIYSVITGFFVLLLLGVQIFYFLGSTRLNNINNTNAELEKTLFRQRELQILTTSAPENLSYELELEDNVSKTTELNNSLQSNILLLEPWTKVISALTFNTRSNKDIDTKEKENMKTNIEVIQEAKGYALILGIYILPLLYGLIGGLTYVLREMRSDVRKYTLDKESTIKYILRIILGAVAGLSVGLFWSDIENAQAVGFTSISLSPMLLAFIAGYCVEHVLGFIDKIIKNVFDNLMPKSKRDEERLTKPDANAQDNANADADKGKATTAKPDTPAKAASLPQPTKLSYFAERM
ncbi:MAG: hypothetical protein II852_09410 [Bacteroidales bacterium]|nr:hypothetical protein [Bacteroidales bacterium]